MRVLRPLAAVTLAVIPVVTVPFALRAQMAAAQHSNRIALEQYLDWEEVQAPQLSPDGTQILFGRRWVDKMNDNWESSIWLMNADGTHQRVARSRIRRAVVAGRKAHRLRREG